MINPTLIPEDSENNLDEECNFKTMFKSPEAKKEFSMHFE
jgi:hypothetical protein